MPITADYHLHSSHSGDSKSPMPEMIHSGIGRGLTHMCFTEHMDYDYPLCEELPENIFLLDISAYQTEFDQCLERFAGQIALHFGIELGLQPHLADQHTALLRSRSFDFVIGSSHVANRRDPYYASFYEGRNEREAYREYFESILENIRAFKGFDVYGHLDYVVRYGPNKDRDYSYADHADVLDEILRILVAEGKGLELNTGALRRGLANPNPCPDILRRYKELGGEIITVGSDAHLPDDIAADFNRAADILKDCGFSHYCIFKNRRPEFIKLD